VVYVAVVLTAIWALWYGLGALIVWRRPEDRGALFSAFSLAILPLGEVSGWQNSSVSAWMGTLFFCALLVFAILFPDGRFRPRWTRWLALLVVVVNAAALPSFPGPTAVAASIASLLVIVPVIGVQVHRFRSLSTWSQRQQSKWAFFGVGVAMVGVAASLMPYLFVRVPNGSLYSAVTGTTEIGIVVTAIPISLAIAVLRSRLWDIDRVISRALAWAALTVVLGAVYIGGVIGLQAAFGRVAGNGSAPAIAVSTLTIVALFGPLRRRLQSLIDRRFYRSRYDAARTVAAFGERLRDQVDLVYLTRDLTSVVHDTLHPDHVALWLRDAADEVPTIVRGAGNT
jgi:hypothetical protein